MTLAPIEKTKVDRLNLMLRNMKEENILKQYSLMITSTDIMFQRIAESLAATGNQFIS